MDYVKKIVYFLSIAIFITNVTANDTLIYDKRVKLVNSLYKNFPSDNLLNTSSINGESKKILSKYFDAPLVSLLWRDRECEAKSDMICSLDFDIIYDSQDPDGAIVNIDLIKQNVEVILDYEKNGKRTLIYYFSKKQGNVKISDIFYQEENRSLKTIIKVSK